MMQSWTLTMSDDDRREQIRVYQNALDSLVQRGLIYVTENEAGQTIRFALDDSVVAKFETPVLPRGIKWNEELA